MKKSKEEIVSMLGYFWRNKSRLDGNTTWDDNLETIKEELPHLYKAWKDYKTAEKTIDAIIESEGW